MRRARRPRRLVVLLAYWLAVVAVALVLVFLLLIFLESRDEGAVGAAERTPARLSYSASDRSSRANTTIRFDALYRGWHALRISRS